MASQGVEEGRSDRDRAGQSEDRMARIKAELAEKEWEALEVIKEDICQWLGAVLTLKITPQSFMETLETGVAVCKLAGLIQQSAKAGNLSSKVPMDTVNYSTKAKPGDFFARDNVANFVSWCRKLGVEEAVIFESEGLVLHKDEKRVILCLLDVARFAGKLDFAPLPQLIMMEQEIDNLEIHSISSSTSEVEESAVEEPAAEKEELNPPQSKRPRKEGNGRKPAKVEKGASKLLPERGETRPKRVDRSIERIYGPKPKKGRGEPPSRSVKGKDSEAKTPKEESIEYKVQQKLEQCSCHEKLRYTINSRGKFVIMRGDKKFTFYARLLSDRVMVRVGGGWDTLDHFLLKHDPCRTHAVSETQPSRSPQQPEGSTPAGTLLGKHKRELRED